MKQREDAYAWNKWLPARFLLSPLPYSTTAVKLFAVPTSGKMLSRTVPFTAALLGCTGCAQSETTTHNSANLPGDVGRRARHFVSLAFL